MEGSPLDEQSLIERAKGGDTAAYGELVRLHEGVAFRAAYLASGDASLAEDAAQEGFIKAYRALGRFRAGSRFRPWLLAIVANEARNARKAAARRGRLAEAFVENRVIQGESARSPESAALGQESALSVLEAISRLKPSDQSAIHMRYFLDLSEAEMADALACRPGTVKSRLSRATGRLRQMIERNYPDLAFAATDRRKA